MRRRVAPRLRLPLRGFGALTDPGGMPILSDAHVTALAYSFGDNDLAKRISTYCREAPCTLVQQQELDAIRAAVKSNIEETEQAKASGETMAFVAAAIGFAFGYLLIKR